MLRDDGLLTCAMYICMDHAEKLHEVNLIGFDRELKPFESLV